MTKEKEKIDIKTKVRTLFDNFLFLKHCRKTSERYAILDLVYSNKEHFDIEWLYKEMEKQSFRVSRSTIYNTMQLLVECHLAQKHQFGKSISVYEHTYGNDLHHHLICNSCKKVMEYKDPGLIQFIANNGMKRFTPTHYSLNIYGICSACSRKNKKKI
ncbi:MAG: transcriptional repressor [Dysgonamonadaceae bacterium]|jgi:Fur family ferric uptake transcriptional regulator|nr:transcriptional repressor [Dysgonamonadaceae bacterium]